MANFVNQGRMYWRFARGLGSFLKEPIESEITMAVLMERLTRRDSNLLNLMKDAVYGNTRSPYLKLLRLAGCEYGDVEHLVESEGAEVALGQLCRAGVYVTLEEFKGARDIRRGSQSFFVSERDFDMPRRKAILSDISGATRSAGTLTTYDFDSLYSYAIHRSLMAIVTGGFRAPLGMWWPTLPGGGPRQLLMYSKAGRTPVKWFTQVGGRRTGPTMRNRILTNGVVFAGRLWGTKWPKPEHTPLSQAKRVASWISGQIKDNGECHLLTYPSSAVRVCQAAREGCLEISGASFIIGGEPYTEAKKKEIESAGAKAYPIYSTVETGMLGQACLNPIAAGEVHLMTDSFALIQHIREVPHSGSSVAAFLFTTLLSSAPKVMLNTENGDYGLIDTRTCQCRLAELGFATHLRDIRGFDKLTAEGMTLVGSDLVKIIEEVLPTRFGGTSTDYQIVESEVETGRTRMTILVAPSVGPIREDELVRVVLSKLPRGGITPDVWSQAGTFSVRREYPQTTARGKLLPLHVAKPK